MTEAADLTPLAHSNETPRIRRGQGERDIVVVVSDKASVDDVRASGPAGAGASEIALRTQLVDRLRGEFGDRFAVDEIRSVVDRAVASLSNARVRTFVAVLAWRQARADLRASVPRELSTPA